MFTVILSLGVILLLLLVVEYLWRTKKLRPEIARKIIHIVAGSFIAFWPYFMSWTTIQLLSLALFIVVYISHQFGIFGSIHSVKRSTNGELLYPVGIGVVALLSPPAWVFTAAILHLSLADGLAAIVGVRYGKNNQYKIRQNVKSFVGSLTFFTVSFIILAVSFALNIETFGPATIGLLFSLPLLVTCIENFFVGGSDNFLVPLVIVAVLERIAI